MWWSFRKSKHVCGLRLTTSRGGLSVGGGIGKRFRVSASRRGGRGSFKLGPFRFGGKLW